MSKKHRKRQERQKPSPRTSTSPKSLLTMADVMPADLLKKIKDRGDQHSAIKSKINSPQSAPLKRQPQPQFPKSSISTTPSEKVSITSRPQTPISRATPSTGTQISKAKESTKNDALDLAE